MFVRGLRAVIRTSLVNVFVEEGAHQPLVRTTAQRLLPATDGGGVFSGIRWTFFDDSTSHALVGRPRLHGVGCNLHLEHPAGQVLADARLGTAAPARGALKGIELAPPFEDGDDPSLSVEVRFDLRVFVLAGDLANPPVRPVPDDKSAACPAASASTLRRVPASALPLQRRFALIRDQPPRPGSGTASRRVPGGVGDQARAAAAGEEALTQRSNTSSRFWNPIRL